MSIRKALILIPLVVTFFLLQSYFWVPTYEEQSRGNPDRLNEYITASIGDASLLNPILSADSASSEIENLVFEGLIDYDQDLRFRGRLAKSWEIYEEAFFYVNEEASVPQAGRLDAEGIVKLLQRAKKEGGSAQTRASLDNIREISFFPPGNTLSPEKRKQPRVRSPLQLRSRSGARQESSLFWRRWTSSCLRTFP